MLDSLHAATALNRDIQVMVSADQAFDDVARLRRLDPVDALTLIGPDGPSSTDG